MDWFLYFLDIHEVVAAAFTQELLEDVIADIGLLLLHHLGPFDLQLDIFLVHIHLLY